MFEKNYRKELKEKFELKEKHHFNKKIIERNIEVNEVEGAFIIGKKGKTYHPSQERFTC